MANVINPNFDYTYDGDLSTEVFIQPAVNHPDILQVFRVLNGINYKQQINITTPLGKVMKGSQGCGTPTVTGDPVNITNREVAVCDWELYLEQCHDTFQATVLGELLRNNVNEPDLVGTQIGNLIQGMVRDAISRDIFRVFSFGDTSSGDPYYNNCDGLWTKLFAGAASYAVTAVNTNITSLAAADIKTEFKNLYTGAEIILKQAPANMKRFFVTGNVYESLMDYYETNANAGGFVAREENGVMNLYYRGIQVVPLYAWDDWIAADNLGNNVRILYTMPENHVVGVQEGRTMGDTRFWYDPNTNYNKIRARFKLGYNYVHDKLQAISYGNV